MEAKHSHVQCDDEPQARESFVSKVDFALTSLVFAMKKLAVSLLCGEIVFSQSERTALAHFLSLIAKFASEPHLVYLKNSLENFEEVRGPIFTVRFKIIIFL